MDLSDTGAGDSYRYGDFPELFWDAKPEVPIDVTSPVTLTRLLERGDAETVGTLVPRDVLRRRLETLHLPEHTKVFWRRVLEYMPDRTPSSPSGR